MPIQAGIGLGLAKDHIQAVKDAVYQAKTAIKNKKIDIAIVFSSVEFAHPRVFQTIGDLLGPITMLGCSSLAIISNEGVFKHGLIIVLFSLSEDIHCSAAVVKEISKKGSLSAGEELAERLLSEFSGGRRDLSIIFSDGLISDGSAFIDGLQERLGKSFPLAGASASDNLAFQKTYLYFNQEILNDSACGMLWGGKLTFGLGIKHGYKPLGKSHTVTSSTGNVVKAIDERPAAKLYAEYLACDLEKLKKDLKNISMLYPMGVYLPGEEEFILRNALSMEKDGSLRFQGSIPEGSQVRLMIGTKESCLQATRTALDEAKKNLLGRAINFVIVFDSASRYMLLGRQANKELEIIREGIGTNTPIVGIYTYGEQAPLRAINYLGRTHFHNQTITLLAFGG